MAVKPINVYSLRAATNATPSADGRRDHILSIVSRGDARLSDNVLTVCGQDDRRYQMAVFSGWKLGAPFEVRKGVAA